MAKKFELNNKIILTHRKKMEPEEMCRHLVEDSGSCLDLYLKKQVQMRSIAYEKNGKKLRKWYFLIEF